MTGGACWWCWHRIVDSINTIIRREFTLIRNLLQEGLINEHFRQGMLICCWCWRRFGA